MGSIKTGIFEPQNGKKRTKNDIILISVLLLAVSLIGLCYFFFRSEGDTVLVTVDGTVFGEYPLSEDCTVELRIGEHFNVLVIRDGEAYIESADCPDGNCISHKPIFRGGESIVCLPNKVVVSVRVVKREAQPDIIA